MKVEGKASGSRKAEARPEGAEEAESAEGVGVWRAAAFR